MSESESRFPEAPSYLQFYPTLRCNASCNFCFNRHMESVPDISLSDFAQLTSKAARLGIGHIDMLGGEPTLHPELFAMIETAAAFDLKITMSTNGSRIPALTALVKSFDRSVLRIGLSVNDDVPRKLHDFIVEYLPIVKSIIGSKGSVPQAAEPYAAHPDIEYYLLYRDAVEENDLKSCTPFYDFHGTIEDLKGRYPGLGGVFCSGFIPDTDSHPVLDRVRCPAGTTKLAVKPDGSVYPCYLLFPYQQFYLGNFITDDFQTIWNHPILEGFRRFKANRCPETGCGLNAVCHGGCPAMSFIFYGDIDGPDPRCVSPV